MKLLLDTHLLIWIASEPEKLTRAAVSMIENPLNELFFSVVNIWEITIKHGLGKLDVNTTPRAFREGCLKNGLKELPITGEHALAVSSLPWIHKDPFDRILIAQAKAEKLTLLTSDGKVARYEHPVILV
jgi:PIN domain nuclease of toxin-antitoxin system